MIQEAALYSRKETLYVRTSTPTTTGAWIQIGSPTVLPDSASLEQIAEAVQRHLEESGAVVPFPGSFDREYYKSDQLLKAAKVGSWRTFGKLAKCVLISADADALKILPTENRHPGFCPMEAAVIELSRHCEPKVFGEKLRQALEASSQ